MEARASAEHTSMHRTAPNQESPGPFAHRVQVGKPCVRELLRRFLFSSIEILIYNTTVRTHIVFCSGNLFVWLDKMENSWHGSSKEVFLEVGGDRQPAIMSRAQIRGRIFFPMI